MTRLTPAILALLIGPSLAAACPTESDLQNAVTIEFEDDTIERYTALGPRATRLETYFEGELGSVIDLGLGVFVLSYMEVWDGRPDLQSRVTTAYPDGIGSLPAPLPGLRWSAETIVTDSDGVFPESIMVAWSDTIEAGIGECRYEALEGIISYAADTDDPFFEGIVYLKEVGIGYVSWVEDSEGRTDYTPTRIAADG